VGEPRDPGIAPRVRYFTDSPKGPEQCRRPERRDPGDGKRGKLRGYDAFMDWTVTTVFVIVFLAMAAVIIGANLLRNKRRKP
jgi:hypothetical protein